MVFDCRLLVQTFCTNLKYFVLIEIYLFQEKMFSCKNCTARFSTADELDQHENKYKLNHFCKTCDVCGESLFNMGDFKEHLKVHSKKMASKKFDCKDCNLSFVSKSSLSIHSRSHSGEKPYSCTVCQRSFKQYSHLVTHIRTHSKDRPFECSLCPSKFSQSGSLKRHIRWENNNYIFYCNFLEDISRRNQVLSRKRVLSHSR